MARKKQTPSQKEYMKQIHRIQNIISRAKRLGYTFLEEIKLPEMPKRVTRKAIEALKEIKPTTIYKKAQYVEKETGEVLTGTQKRKEVKSKGGKKASRQRRKPPKPAEDKYIGAGIKDRYANLILNRFQKMFRTDGRMNINPMKNTLIRMMEELIAIYEGREDELDAYLKKHETAIAMYLNVITYDSKEENVQVAFKELAIIINQAPLSRLQEEEINDMMDEMSWGIDEEIASGFDYYDV